MIKTYVAIYIIDVIGLIFLARLLHNNNVIGSYRKKPFLYGILFTNLIILLEGGTILVDRGGNLQLRGLNILYNTLGFALAPIIPIILIGILDRKVIKKYKIFLLPTMLNFIVTILSPYFGWFFYVDTNNNYQRGNLFFLFVLVYMVNIIILLAHILYRSKKPLYPIRWKVVALTLFILMGTCIQLFIPSVYSSWHCVTISLFLLYILLNEFDGSLDILTGLYNRAAFEKAAKHLTGKEPFTVIALDIDNFKGVNDTYGHEYGDTVLKEVACIIINSFDKSCSSYRIGGDEFCVICMHTSLEKLENQLKSMTNNLGQKRENDRYLPTVAYGYSISERGNGLDFQSTLKKADDQMYYYKEKSKNKTTQLI